MCFYLFGLILLLCCSSTLVNCYFNLSTDTKKHFCNLKKKFVRLYRLHKKYCGLASNTYSLLVSMFSLCSCLKTDKLTFFFFLKVLLFCHYPMFQCFLFLQYCLPSAKYRRMSSNEVVYTLLDTSHSSVHGGCRLWRGRGI